MNPQVLTTITSASEVSGVITAPDRESFPRRISESTRFFEHPRLITLTFMVEII